MNNLLGSFPWYDVLCINQHDTTERSSQVSGMCDMYNSASKVLVWLGDASDGTDDVVDYFQKPEGQPFIRDILGYQSATREMDVVMSK